MSEKAINIITKSEIKKQKDLILDKDRLLKVWKKAPALHKVQMAEARRTIKAAELRIGELELILEDPVEVKTNQISMFDEPSFAKGSGMVNKAVNIDLKVSKAHELLIPDRVHQEEVLDDVEVRKIKNKSQNQMVLELFMMDKNKKFTAWKVIDWLKLPVIRITSIRRAMSDLTKEGLLTKLDETVMEREGEKNHLYQFRKK